MIACPAAERRCPSGDAVALNWQQFGVFIRIMVRESLTQNSFQFWKKRLQRFFILILCCKISSLWEIPGEVRVRKDVEGQDSTPDVPSPTQVLPHARWKLYHSLSSFGKCKTPPKDRSCFSFLAIAHVEVIWYQLFLYIRMSWAKSSLFQTLVLHHTSSNTLQCRMVHHLPTIHFSKRSECNQNKEIN